MVNPINGLPPVILEKNVQEVEPNNKELGEGALTTAGKANSGAHTGLAAELAQKPKQAQAKDAPEEKADNKVDFSKLADVVKSTIGNENYNIVFKRDKDSEQMIMQVIDTESNEVVKQFPPEITMKISKIVAKLMETAGQVMNAKV